MFQGKGNGQLKLSNNSLYLYLYKETCIHEVKILREKYSKRLNVKLDFPNLTKHYVESMQVNWCVCLPCFGIQIVYVSFIVLNATGQTTLISNVLQSKTVNK